MALTEDQYMIEALAAKRTAGYRRRNIYDSPLAASSLGFRDKQGAHLDGFLK